MTASFGQCTMVGVGFAWASILAMPYAILSGALPAARMGVYNGHLQLFHRDPGNPLPRSH